MKKNQLHLTRREFLRVVSAAIPAAALPIGALAADGTVGAAAGAVVLLEAERFEKFGGWVLDQQFMEQMGSPYLLAHGLGEPVQDAETSAVFAPGGEYRVWVRTRDWVAPWKAPGAPGRFQVCLDGVPVGTTFGTEGAQWHWQDGGTVRVAGKVKVSLHDLTGFEGRCDAVLFCRDLSFQPPNERAALAVFRRWALGLPLEPEDGGQFDLVVAGGGIAGCCAAVTAARLGLKVALVQDRPVLGGNGSSEVRVWPEGNIQQPPFPRVGDVVAELVPAKHPKDGNAGQGAIYADARKLAVVRAEPGITLLTEQRVNAVETLEGQITAVVAEHTHTGRRVRLTARWFADCTGDGTIGFLAGADHELSRVGHLGASDLWNVRAAEPGEALKCACTDTNALNQTVFSTGMAAPFPRCPWAIDLSDKPFPGRKKFSGQPAQEGLNRLGNWFWESGFDHDPITDVEWMRDQNLRAMYGAWDALKNVDHAYPEYKLGWAAFIAGKRESRRLLGDVVLDADDFRQGRVWPDGAFPCSWSIDLHKADGAPPRPGEEPFLASATAGKKGYTYKGPYWAPYRCLYSRNITNLFMAGRDISVTHNGLGPVRVMRTCGMMGEVVGMAAALCKRRETSPRGVYEQHLEALKELMQKGAGKAATGKV